MHLIDDHSVLEFLTWLAHERPTAESIIEINERELARLTDEWLQITGVRSSSRGVQWRVTVRQLVIAVKGTRFTTASAAERAAANLHSLAGVRRYRSVPLHAIFLYSTEDGLLRRYIEENWQALHRASSEFCDIYSSLKQLEGNGDDVYALINQGYWRSGPIPGIGRVPISTLPGLLFWDRRGDWAYYPIAPGRDLSTYQIRSAIRSVLERVRQHPTLNSVREATSLQLNFNETSKDLRMSSNDSLRVVFFASNPFATSRLALDTEAREIGRKVRMATHRDRLTITHAWATQTEDLLQYLNEISPQIVHFSGHGNRRGEVILNSAAGGAQVVSEDALRSLFGAFRREIQAVVLNCCFSERQAKVISEIIPTVIGMRREISDRSASTFASSFYSALCFGRTVNEAFEQGRVALALDGVDSDIPIILG